MDHPEYSGKDEATGRALYFLQVADPRDLPQNLAVGPHFVCLLAWDSEFESVEEISRVAEILLDAGCVYFCTWGSGCERVHDVIDEVIVEREVDGGFSPAPDDDRCILTTWHDREPLEQALWTLLNCSHPDEGYEQSCRSVVAIMIGSDPSWAATTRDALSHPEAFSERILDAEETDDGER